MDGVDDYAAVNESVNLVKALGQAKASSFVNGVLRSFLRDGKRIPPVTVFRGQCVDHKVGIGILRTLTQKRLHSGFSRILHLFPPVSVSVAAAGDQYQPQQLCQRDHQRGHIGQCGGLKHPFGAAQQHAQKYAPMQLRAAIIPVTNLGSKLSIPLFVAGLILSYQPLCNIGLLLFSLAAIFQLVTLPVEFDASAREPVRL